MLRVAAQQPRCGPSGGVVEDETEGTVPVRAVLVRTAGGHNPARQIITDPQDRFQPSTGVRVGHMKTTMLI